MNEPLLAAPPESPRSRELWLNHAVGYMLFRDVRNYARERLEPSLGESERQAAYKAIDDAVYGVMMVLDGVPSPLQNECYRVELESELVLYNGENEIERTSSFEGFCMGYHYWIDGDFGENPILETKSK